MNNSRKRVYLMRGLPDCGKSLVSNGEPGIAPAVYSAIVVIVIVTTLVTPPLLSWSLRRT